MVSRIDTRTDVSSAVGFDTNVETAAWVYLPDPNTQLSDPVVLFALPGGTYTRAYYDLDIPGRTGYSLARHLATLGIYVVACDHIGIGDSTPYEPFDALTMDVVVRADCALVNGLMARLTTGHLVEGLRPLVDPFTIGLGHSMGAHLVTLMQAEYRSFDALALLGFSQLEHTENDFDGLPRSVLSAIRENAESLSKLSDLSRPPRVLFHEMFHDERVPADVIQADDSLATRVYPWIFSRSRRAKLREAAQQIDVPLLVSYGIRDVSPDPRREPTAYPRSTDITSFVLPNAAHCSNFAETRRILFERLAQWAISIASTYRKRLG